MKIYISKDGEIYGPFSQSDAYQQIREGAFAPDDMAFRHKRDEMRPLIDLVCAKDTQGQPKNPRKGNGVVVAVTSAVFVGLVIILTHKSPKISEGELQNTAASERSRDEGGYKNNLIQNVRQKKSNKELLENIQRLIDVCSGYKAFLEGIRGVSVMSVNQIREKTEDIEKRNAQNDAYELRIFQKSVADRYEVYFKLFKKFREFREDFGTESKIEKARSALYSLDELGIKDVIKDAVSACEQTEAIANKLSGRYRTEMDEEVAQLKTVSGLTLPLIEEFERAGSMLKNYLSSNKSSIN